MYLRELESLRGIAMLMVFWFHVDAFVVPVMPAGSPPVGFLRGWIRSGHAGVDLFFVLSAFLLALPFLDEAAGGGPVDLARYARRRALRILPAYWAAVLVGTIACAERPESLLLAIPYGLFLGPFLPPAAALFPYSAVWWSLWTEFQFYLVLPFVGAWRRSRGWRVASGLVLGGLVLAHLAFLAGVLPVHRIGLPYWSARDSLIARLPAFVCGILAAELYRRRHRQIRAALAASAFWSRGGADLALLAVVAVLAWEFRWSANATLAQRGGAHVSWHSFVGLLWALVVLLLLLAPLRVKRLLVNPLFDRCGTLSYSVYLIHAPFMYLGLRLAGGLSPAWRQGWSWSLVPVVAVLTVLCFAFASATYRWLELPFLRRKEAAAG